MKISEFCDPQPPSSLFMTPPYYDSLCVIDSYTDFIALVPPEMFVGNSLCKRLK